ncbi:MAG: PAM68 family protein [Prochlorothrix sp.]|nr:PAM68 family protein [Prochlorothrix sp.]
MAKDQSDSRLPFEPKGNRKKSSGPAANTGTTTKAPEKGDAKGKKQKKSPATLDETRIPDVVSNRMVRRIAIFSGVPTALGIASFVLSYWVVTQGIAEVPNSVVVVGSLLLFGAGTLGLSYGVLSASWEENREGSFLGFEEFQVNLKRFIDSWREFRQSRSQKKKAEATSDESSNENG